MLRRVLVSLTAVVSLGLLPAGASAAEGCENEARRVEQNATYLPDCRAYEKVSPADKGNGDIVGDGQVTISSELGDAVAFSAHTLFGDAVASGNLGQTQYVARRGAGGWATHSVTPLGRPDAYQTVFAKTFVELFSTDLRTAFVLGYDLPGGGGEPERMNFYSEDAETRAVRSMTTRPPALIQEDGALPSGEYVNSAQQEWGISANARHVAIVSKSRLRPEAPPGVRNIYQWDDGALTLAGILPDGSIPESGSEGAAEWRPRKSLGYRGTMSADGSRLLFTAAPNGLPQLYMRIDGERTAWISEPENGESVEPTEVHLQYMTPDGRYVFFVTESKLLSEDENEGPDLYRWTYGPDPEHEKNLTMITNTGTAVLFKETQTAVPGVVGASDDGSRVYYDTEGGLLVVWDNGVTRVVSPYVVPDSSPRNSLAAVESTPGLGRVTPDGMFLAFVSNSTSDSVHGLTGQVTNEHYEVYLYSLAEDKLTCVSCPSGSASSDATVVPNVSTSTVTYYNTSYRPNFLSDDGRVFFSTAEALLPQDVNGVMDTYEYDPASARLSLLSPGAGRYPTLQPTMFADASASGNDVFVLTREQLLREDTDSLVDLYDVRVNGGLPQPAVPGPCAADECQAPPVAPPSFGAPATVGFAGAGNLAVPAAKHAVPSSKRRALSRALRECRRRRSRRLRKRCETRVRARFVKNGARGSK